jgi:hypothetical protein
MFQIVKVQEIGCCSDTECSGVRLNDTVYALKDEENNSLIDFELDWPELDLDTFLEGMLPNSDIGTGFETETDAQEALDSLISHIEAN